MRPRHTTGFRSGAGRCWLTEGGGLADLLVGAVCGWPALVLNLLRVMVGGALLLTFVRAGSFGAGDAPLLAVIDAWHDWRFVLWTAWWKAPVGTIVALVA